MNSKGLQRTSELPYLATKAIHYPWSGVLYNNLWWQGNLLGAKVTRGYGGVPPGGGPEGKEPLCGGQGTKPPEADTFVVQNVIEALTENVTENLISFVPWKYLQFLIFAFFKTWDRPPPPPMTRPAKKLKKQ